MALKWKRRSKEFVESLEQKTKEWKEGLAKDCENVQPIGTGKLKDKDFMKRPEQMLADFHNIKPEMSEDDMMVVEDL